MVLAGAVERRTGNFNVQELVNTAWVVATLGQLQAQLFVMSARTIL